MHETIKKFISFVGMGWGGEGGGVIHDIHMLSSTRLHKRSTSWPYEFKRNGWSSQFSTIFISFKRRTVCKAIIEKYLYTAKM